MSGTSKLLGEFKAFVMRGNVVDMAVGVIIGLAFGKVVSSLVANVIMPPIGLLLGKVDFASLKIVLQPASVDAATGKPVAEVAIAYGAFINAVIELLIVAFVVFLMVKLMAAFRKQSAAAPPTKDQELLTEIRDILKSKS